MTENYALFTDRESAKLLHMRISASDVISPMDLY
ncbi:hypothetical protein HNQ74_001216 [Bartonella doshiae]|nr:hypothetical protein [Bartonella doshiae]